MKKRKRTTRNEFVTSSTREEEFAQKPIYVSGGEFVPTENPIKRKLTFIYQTCMGRRNELNHRFVVLKKQEERIKKAKAKRQAREDKKSRKEHVMQQKLMRLQDKFNG